MATGLVIRPTCDHLRRIDGELSANATRYFQDKPLTFETNSLGILEDRGDQLAMSTK